MDELYMGKARNQDNGTRQTNGPNENTAGNGGVKYSVSESFAGELQDWFDRTSPEERSRSGIRFLVGTTTETLKKIGVREYEIYFGASKINKILTQNSSMSLDTIKQAVMLLEDPILIMKSETVEDSIVLFGEVYTSGNKPVMISLLLNPKTKSGEVLDYAVITSAYGRRVNNLQHLIDNSKIYYVNENKNRTERWLKALGLQLPSALTKFGPIDSILNSGSDVNTKVEETSEDGEEWVSWENFSPAEMVQAQVEGRYDNATRMVRVPKKAETTDTQKAKSQAVEKTKEVKSRFSTDDTSAMEEDVKNKESQGRSPGIFVLQGRN